MKLAMSLDGCIATAVGESQWISGEVARAHVHSRRAIADAILVGGGTWRADKPRLDVDEMARQAAIENAREAAEAEARRRELYRAGSTVDDTGE